MYYWLLPLLLSIFTWTYPQPIHSSGLLVIYGNQRLVEANADWHEYDLSPYSNRCGLASISPSMLGKIAWIRRDGHRWIGPCLVVDVVSRKDAYGSIYLRKEIAEITYADAETLDFLNGGRNGYVWFGYCPPPFVLLPPAEKYAPPLEWDYAPYEHTPSFHPYPKQQMPVDCSRRNYDPVGYTRYE